MTKEALMLALEALNLPSMKTEKMLAQRDEAITAIKEALAQLEQEPEPDALTVVYMSGVYEGRKLEREACALTAENHPAYDWHKAPCEITYAIRARGEHMNERIKELAEQAGFYYTDKTGFITPAGCDPAKFAELIVKECAELVETQHTWITSVAASALIRKHFGVEE